MTIYESLDDLDDRTRKQINTMLGDDETYITGVSAGGFLSRLRQRAILTSKNFITVNPQTIIPKTHAVSLSGISAVEVDRGGALSTVRIRGPGGLDEEHRFPNDEGAHLADALRDQLAKPGGF